MDALSKPRSTMVTLPDGKSVTISNEEESWWSQQGGSGYTSLDLLAPDPKNPRRSIDQAKFNELKLSVRSSGVKQQLVVTPRNKVPWLALPPEHEGKPFVIVSGWRRYMAAIEEKMPAVPVTVEIYETSKQHRLAASLYNRHRVDPSAVDDAYDMLQLHEEEKWTYTEIADHFGLSQPYIYLRIGLTKLDPELQKLVDEYERGEKPLKISVGQALGTIKTPQPEELGDVLETFSDVLKGQSFLPSGEFDELDETERRFLLQRMLYTVIDARSLGAVRAIALIKDRTLRMNSHKTNSYAPRTDRFRPSRRKDRLLTCIKAATEGEINDWNTADWAKTFELSSYEDVDDVLKQATMARDLMITVVEKLTRIRNNKKPLNPELQDLLLASKGESRPAPPSRPTSERVGTEKVAPAASTVSSIKGEKTVTYMGPMGRMVTDKVSQGKYVDLWDKGQLQFQQKGTERPEFLPTREQALNEWNKWT